MGGVPTKSCGCARHTSDFELVCPSFPPQTDIRVVPCTFGAECRRCVLHERDVIAQLHAVASGRLDARVGDETDEDDLLYPVLLKLHVEVGRCEPALRPMLLDDHVAFLRSEFLVELATPCADFEHLTCLGWVCIDVICRQWS